MFGRAANYCTSGKMMNSSLVFPFETSWLSQETQGWATQDGECMMNCAANCSWRSRFSSEVLVLPLLSKVMIAVTFPACNLYKF